MSTPTVSPDNSTGNPKGNPTDNARYQRAWYWYDWANSAFVTTTSTVLFGPYLTAVAKSAACPGQSSDMACHADLFVLGVPISPGSLASYTVTVSTLLSAVLLIFAGAVADRVTHPTRLLGVFAWCGAGAASAMVFVSGTNWVLGVVLLIIANQFLGASLVVYDGLLVRISRPQERDRVSSRGWALGYLGGGLLLAVNLVVVTMHDRFGLSTGASVRLSLLSAGLWWAAFTLIPVLGMRGLQRIDPGSATSDARPDAGLDAGGVGGALRQLRQTFAHLRRYPQTLTFLLAYLFFNDGIQTVIVSASIFGKEELGLSETQLIITVLLVQFVAFVGALIFGRLAERTGAQRAVLLSLVLWTGVVVAAFFLPHRQFVLWLVLSVGIGLVLGGSQALSRSLYSRLVPVGRESEYFSLYQAMERGTSWFGTLTFGLVHQWTGSYRLSILALVAFFALGGWLLRRVDVEEGVRAAAVPETA